MLHAVEANQVLLLATIATTTVGVVFLQFARKITMGVTSSGNVLYKRSRNSANKKNFKILRQVMGNIHLADLA